MSNITLKATIMWAQLDTVNDLSGKYQVDLCQLSDKAVEALYHMGIEARFKDDRGHFITCKSSRPITATDSSGVSLQGIKVGNESQAVAVVSPYTWTFKNKTGQSPSLKKLVITHLEVFEEGDEVTDSVDLDEAL